MTGETAAERECAFGDPTCPCRDGDACHYAATEDTHGMTPPIAYLAQFIVLMDDGLPYLFCTVCRVDEPLPEPADLASIVEMARNHVCDVGDVRSTDG